ncbi:methionine synthase reductase [Caerostris extrusa]|uniref:Methionine synthase reductase n=1 Tax=Caerostris extrusa TaxID=172846 RepID=A0AAV4RG87_CAEEX|nr:methionine synthase reductase [Caerostris extrusa]
MTAFQPQDLKRFILLYASQTGQAQAIAEEISETAPFYGLIADIYCLSLTDRKFCIEKETCAVFIVSTTGDGEPPDTAVKFYRRTNGLLLNKNYLKKLNYTLLALGDSNYDKFCLFGRNLNKHLECLSAKLFYEVGYGDDAYGIGTCVDPWIKNLWPALQKLLGVEPSTTNGFVVNFFDENYLLKYLNMTSIESLSDEEIKTLTLKDIPHLIKYSHIDKLGLPSLPSPKLAIAFEETVKKACYMPNKNFTHPQASDIFKVRLTDAKKLTSEDTVKNTFELTFELEIENNKFSPGDAFGFICPNPPDEVETLLERLNIIQYAETPVKLHTLETSAKRKLFTYIPQYLSLRDIFLHCIEIRSVPKKILSEYTSDLHEKHALLFLSNPIGAKFYTSCIRDPSISILDILMTYQSCNPPVEKLLEHLPCLKPRFYSVASSPLQDNKSFKIVFNVLKISNERGRYKDREGVCTDGMSNLSLGCNEFSIFTYMGVNIYFYPPDNLKFPIIMVGPGTGVAPFIGFLQHREKQLETVHNNCGESWLFYGCRYKDKDFLYRSELYRLQSAGILSHLKISHSREEPLPSNITSRYVHESIKQNSDAIAAAVCGAGGRIFICGDGKHMAKDVEQAFTEVFQLYNNFSASEAKEYVHTLKAEKRYVCDVWG